MLSTSKHVLLRLAVALTAVAAVAAVWSGAALAADGTLEVCKSSLNGMAGKSFEFSISGGNTITVRGGRCSGPMLVPAGAVTITELSTRDGAAAEVAAVQVRPSSRLISSNLVARQVVVNVVAGSTAATETRVTYVNQPAGGTKGDLKICKLTETPAFYGRQFSFTVNGGPAISTEANPAFDDPAHWSCRLAGTFTVGSKLRVQELVPAGAEVAWIDSDPAACLDDFDTNEGWADVTIGAGACVVLFDNEAPAPEGTGWIEICKDRAKLGYYDLDWDVQGEFDFEVLDAAGDLYELTVLAGQCSAPIQIAAGIASVTELARAGYTLVDVYTIPEDRLLGHNLINQTAEVEIPVSDSPNDETQVHFVNKTQRAQLKLCKALGPGSSALVGKPFLFHVSDGGNGLVKSEYEYVQITSSTTTQCKIVGEYPIGAELHIDELFANERILVPALNGLYIGELLSEDYIKATGEGTVVIKPGINTVTVTNTARGKLEICKFVTDAIEGNLLTREFTFNVSGGVGSVKVRPGRCSPPILVTPGTYTVTEDLTGNPEFELDTSHVPSGGIAVTPSTAELSRNTLARSVTVAVPYAGPYGDEVRVDFYNRIRRGQIKVCKHITPGSTDSLGGKTFRFEVRTTHPRVPGPISVGPLGPEECALVLFDGSVLNLPILTPSGAQTVVGVKEVANPPSLVNPPDEIPPAALGEYYISDLHLQGGRGGLDANCVFASYSPTGKHCLLLNNNPFQFNAHVRWNLGPNTNTIHFTNTAGDP